MTNRLLVPLALTAILSAACSHGAPTARGTTTTTNPGRIETVAALQRADSCGDLLGWIHTQAAAQVGPYGMGGGVAVPQALAANGASRFAPEAASGASAGSLENGSDAAVAGSPSGTNDQEAGVDELDRFKTDGHRVVMTDGQRLMSIDISGATPTKLGEVDLPMSGARLFLRGDHVLAAGTANSQSSTGQVELADVDLSGGAPRVAATASVDGQLLDGRLSGSTIRLVVTTPEPTRLSFTTPSGGDGAAVLRALAANRAIVAGSTIGQWLPSWTAPDGTTAPLLDCGSTFHPQAWAGAAVLSVLSIGDELTDLHPTGVVTDGQTIYASTASLYVATQQTATPTWGADGSETFPTISSPTSSIHRFDISTNGAAAYQGSGTVPGTVLDQYSLSEGHGDLRVVTTTGESRGRIVEPQPFPCPTGTMCPLESAGTTATGTATSAADGTAPTTTAPATVRSLLTVLRLENGSLAQVGQLDGLGADEQVKTVRFLGDMAYIVTFRSFDPLFVVDASDPTAPRLLGQLTTPGFSAYLHPVGPNLLFGIGTTISANEPDGAKVVLYDTSNPTQPAEVASIPISGGASTVDTDTHAFTWDAEHHLAFLSLSLAGGQYDVRQRDGMAVYRIDGHTITWVGYLDHDAHSSTTGGSSGDSGSSSNGGFACPADASCVSPFPVSSPVDRVIVVGDRVFAASDAGVSVHPIDTLAESGWIGW